MTTWRPLGRWMLVLGMLGITACGVRPTGRTVASLSARATTTKAAPVRVPAGDRELERYAEREQRAAGLDAFEGGRRRGDMMTIVIVLLVVIVVILII